MKIFEFNAPIEKYKYKGIYVFGIMQNLQLGFDTGYIQEVDNSLFGHNCNTQSGYSGGAIINKENNCVIGIHKGKGENSNYNIGIYMKSILNDIKIKNNYFDINSSMNFPKSDSIVRKNYNFQVIIRKYNSEKPQALSMKEAAMDILGYRINLNIYSINEGDNYSSINYNFVHCIIYLYDIGNKYNLNKIYNFLMNLIKQSNNKNIMNILIGKNYNLGKEREVSELEGRQFATLNKMHFFELSPNSINSKALEFIAIALIKKYCNKELLPNDKIIEIYKPYLNALFFNNDTFLIYPTNIYDINNNYNPYLKIPKQMKESGYKIEELKKSEIIDNNKDLNEIHDITI